MAAEDYIDDCYDKEDFKWHFRADYLSTRQRDCAQEFPLLEEETDELTD